MTTELEQYVMQGRLVDTHEHLLSEATWVGTTPPCSLGVRYGAIDVVSALFWNYVEHDLISARKGDVGLVQPVNGQEAGDTEARLKRIVDGWAAVRATGYGEAVEAIARAVFGVEDLRELNLDEATRALKELRAPGQRKRLLSETAGLDHVQINVVDDTPHPDPSAGGFFLHDLSVVSLASGGLERRPDELDPAEAGLTTESVDESIGELFTECADSRIAVKTQHAYTRTLAWESRTITDVRSAQRRLAVHPDDREARLIVGDWALGRVVELAVEHNLPVKIHTGYLANNGDMRLPDVNPSLLWPLLRKYPDARFVLMHAGYPYQDELLALCKHYRNVWIDFCWAWAVNPLAMCDFLRRCIHAVPCNKIFAFGGDTFLPTAVIGYATQARRWLARALDAEVVAGDLSVTEAIDVASRLMWGNQYECFDIDGTRRAIAERLAMNGEKGLQATSEAKAE